MARTPKLPKRAATLSPDESLTGDDSLIAPNSAGLVYPWGAETPAPGETMEVGEGVHWVRLPLPGSLGHINSWLIEDSEGTAIVDTGLMLETCSAAWKALFTGPLAARPVSRVIVTHLHPDHVGLAGWIAKRFDCRIWMTRGEWLMARLILAEKGGGIGEEEAAFLTAAGWSEDNLEEARQRKGMNFASVTYPLPRGYHRMKDGDVLRIGADDWRIVVGSGHSPEHACLLNERQGLFIAGDQVLPRISSNVSLGAFEPDADPLREWLNSIDRLLGLPDDLLVCPAHGEPFRGLHTRLKALRDEHLSRLDQLAVALKAPLRAVDCFSLLFHRTIGADHRWLATGEALAHLRYLETDGRIVRESTAGVDWYRAA